MNVSTLKEVRIFNYKRPRIKDRWIFDSGFVIYFNKGIVITHQVWPFNYYFIFYIASVCCAWVCICALAEARRTSGVFLYRCLLYSLRQGLTPVLKPTISAAQLSGQEAFWSHMSLPHSTGV